MRAYFKWPNVCLVYPTILVLGTIINTIVREETLDRQKHEYYILSSKNILNRVFAYNGNLIWAMLFGMMAYFQVWIRIRTQDLLPRDAQIINRQRLQRLIKQYIVKFVLKYLLLFITFLFIDGLFLFTGGQCTYGLGIWSAEKCKNEGGHWEGGFDISGHFCFLMNVSLILWCELSILERYLRDEELEMETIITNYSVLLKCILYLWMSMLCVTAIYYHTLLEKILGCLLGYCCPLIMYWLIPNHYKLNHILYS
ncbi:hypothetical protein NCAS_0F02860 [Naumovozyma castellii]|uniref:Acyl-coenzyme A diphosphatase YFT2 n=1 Tax=Naumovozyma castellii TaxID=27288 RepID=G0VGZ9_NAUCA|nr:hypothetical protein NCAS_0F02860 [Naumovozyma castellii CBS 4309]CCC70770.1 hypothetical protein NCAS_0F02860 [Naumovozyma castellii CBS 4309]